jgi:hypothetical protein
VPTIVTRAGWGARAPKSSIPKTTWSRRTGFAVHHTAGPTTQTVREIQNFQMDGNGWSDIGYNWLVDQDGKVYEGRSGGWLAIGAHAGGQNTAWVGVCWIGTSGINEPSAAALASIRWLYDEANRLAGRRLNARGHGQVPGQSTECPGSRLRAWIAAGMPTKQKEDDVPIDKTDANRIFRYDGSIDAPNLTAGGEKRDSSANPTWAANSAIGAIYDNVARARADLRVGLAKAAAERAAIRELVTGLAGAVQLTPQQVDQLAAAVAEAGDGAAREMLDRLEAAGEALAGS